MQMRRCAVWVSLLALFAFASPALAAPPKGKKHRKEKEAAAADSADATAAPVEKEKVKDVDSLMEDSIRNKPEATSKPVADEPEKVSDDVGEPDAWERPPAEEEKPKKKKFAVEPEAPKGDGRNMEIGIYAGYAFGFGGTFGGGGGDPYGLGGGLQGTYTLENHIVLGLGGEIYLGTTNVETVALANVETYHRYLHIHALVGYDFWFDKWLLRPSLWVGASLGLTTVRRGYESGIFTSMFLAPGLALHRMLGDSGWYFGADVHLTVVLGSKSTNGLPILLTFGKRF